MGIGTGVFLLVLGAILTFAVHVTVDGINVHALGAILMVVGAAGVVLSFFYWDRWGGLGGRRSVYRDERTFVDPVVPVAPAAPVVPVAPVAPAAPAVPAMPVVAHPAAGVPVVPAGPAVAVDEYGVPVAPVVGAPARVVRRPVEVTRTTVYDDIY